MAERNTQKTMRILITGVNPVQCGHRPRMDYISFILAIKAAAEQSKADVEVRPVTVGEDLSGYDHVVTFLAPVRGFIAKHPLGVLWAIGQTIERGALTLAFDDWQIPQAVAGLRAFRGDFDKLITEDPFGYSSIEHVPKYRNELLDVAELFAQDTWLFDRALVPVYDGGNTDLLGIPMPRSAVKGVNPSAFFVGRYGQANQTFEQWSTNRKREWAVAALHDHSSWLKKQRPGWPIAAFGSRKLKQPRLAESAIYTEYLLRVGVLSPAYKTVGSGWWRARFGLSADALSIIVCDAAEAHMISDTMFSLTASEVEQLSEVDQFELALEQRAAYYAAAGNTSSATDQIMAALR